MVHAAGSDTEGSRTHDSKEENKFCYGLSEPRSESWHACESTGYLGISPAQSVGLRN